MLRKWRGQPEFIRASCSGGDKSCVDRRRALGRARLHFLQSRLRRLHANQPRRCPRCRRRRWAAWWRSSLRAGRGCGYLARVDPATASAMIAALTNTKDGVGDDPCSERRAGVAGDGPHRHAQGLSEPGAAGSESAARSLGVKVPSSAPLDAKLDAILQGAMETPLAVTRINLI